MPIIDSTYFFGEIAWPNIAQTDELTICNNAIARYEPEWLEIVLGAELYGLFMAAYDASVDEDSPVALDDRYDWILNGHTYTYNDKSYTWKGLVNTAKLSPIAHYVWYKKTVQAHRSAMGLVQLQPEVAKLVNPTQDLLQVWNTMSDWTYPLAHMLQLLDSLESPGTLVYSDVDTCNWWKLKHNTWL